MLEKQANKHTTPKDLKRDSRQNQPEASPAKAKLGALTSSLTVLHADAPKSLAGVVPGRAEPWDVKVMPVEPHEER